MPQTHRMLRGVIVRGGVLLGMSAILGKALGLLRDRLLLETFGQEGLVDFIFAAFRVPDFFFFLLVGGVVSTLLLPRMQDTPEKEHTEFLSSFFFLVGIGFGVLCLLGALLARPLAHVIGAGLPPEMYPFMIPNIRWLFGASFFLALSSVLAAYLQFQKNFLPLALAPLVYTSMICLSVYGFGQHFGLWVVGIGAAVGAGMVFLMYLMFYLFEGGTFSLSWMTPKKSWHHMGRDFLARVGVNATFQINQTLDIIIAGFLALGSVTAFTLGSQLGHVLLTVLGLPLANSAFPLLSETKHNLPRQKRILIKTCAGMLAISVPLSLAGFVLGKWLLELIFALEPDALRATWYVFSWTVVSLPLACLLPLFSRVFLAHGDTRTPLIVSGISLSVATALAAYLCFVVLPSPVALVGLGVGNAVANTLSALLYIGFLFRLYRDVD